MSMIYFMAIVNVGCLYLQLSLLAIAAEMCWLTRESLYKYVTCSCNGKYNIIFLCRIYTAAYSTRTITLVILLIPCQLTITNTVAFMSACLNKWYTVETAVNLTYIPWLILYSKFASASNSKATQVKMISVHNSLNQ